MKRHPICKYPEVRCPNMEAQNGQCLLRNLFSCKYNPPEAVKEALNEPDR